MNLNEVPATGTRMRKNVFSRDRGTVGQVNFIADWGAMFVNRKPARLQKLQMHFILYLHSFRWHLQHAACDVLQQPQLEVRRFLYIPALSLINQHRIQCDLSWTDDALLRRCALLHLLTQDKESNNVSNSKSAPATDQANPTNSTNPGPSRAASNSSSDQIPISEHWLVTLSCMLANEALAESIQTIGQRLQMPALQQLEILLLDRLMKKLIRDLKPMFTTLQPNRTFQLLQLIRAFAHFEHKYSSCSFRDRFNSALSDLILLLANESFSNRSRWDQLIDLYENLDECLLKHWTQGLGEVLDNQQSIVKLKKLFDEQAGPIIKQLIEQWQLASTRSDQKQIETVDVPLMKAYVFVQRLDSLLCRDRIDSIYVESTAITITTDSKASPNDESTMKSTLSSNNQLPIIERISPNTRTANRSTSTMIVTPDHVQSRLATADFCGIHKNHDNSNMVNTYFPAHVLHHWLHSRSRMCMQRATWFATQQLNAIHQHLKCIQTANCKFYYCIFDSNMETWKSCEI